MTLQEFFKSDERLAIHCETIEQAIKFSEKADELGYKWDDGKSYLIDDFWNDYENKTCYTNDGFYENLEYYKKNGYTILSFDEIEFKDYQTPRDLYKKYGKDLQLNMVIEEMAELTKEILKDKRGKGIRENIVEELADVLFTLEYVKIAFNIADDDIRDSLEAKGLVLNVNK